MAYSAQSKAPQSVVALEHFRGSKNQRASKSKITLAAALASLFVIGSVAPSVAFPSRVTSAAAPSTQNPMTEIVYRGHRYFNAPYRDGFHGHAQRRSQSWRYGGAAIGAGVVGLAAGALLSEAVASPAPMEEEVSYCANRFKSYDPSTGTYLGYDGVEHPCP